MSYPFGDSQTVSLTLLKQYDNSMQEGDARYPHELLPFLRKNGKLIVFFTATLTLQSPIGSVAFYSDLLVAGKQASVAPQQNVALFMVPGMGHCSGGPTPTKFDSLSALQDWTEPGVYRRHIMAINEDDLEYSMPLCPDPQTTKLTGPPTRTASNWRCQSTPH
jgi:feruloyl esterase